MDSQFPIQLSAIQMCSSTDIEANLQAIELQLKTLPKQVKHLVVLPECCLFFGGKDKEQLSLAIMEQEQQSLQRALSELAQRYGIFLVAGSIPLFDSTTEKFTNSCLVFSPKGEEVGRYDKLHLFDVAVQDNEKNYAESRYATPGKNVSVVDIDGLKVGLSICYDLRFPELFRQLCQGGAKIITVPAAFTRVTGQAHWETLLRARAIENQVYIIASGQEGVHLNGRETWGHSMIISPWGEIIALHKQGDGMISAPYQEEAIINVRQAMPVNTHNRFINELK